jgi:putative NADH-flavin reductase
MAHILVVGASRGVGLETVRAALAGGHRVRAFARSANALGLSNSRLEKYQGDALNVAEVTKALGGVDAVIQTLGVRARDLLKPVTLFSQATRVLVAAMEQSGVRRLIALTGYGAGDSRSTIGMMQRVPFLFIFGRAYDDKDLQEQMIKRSDLEWTIVRPGVLAPGPASRRYKVLVERSQWRNGVVARADVADFMVAQVGSPQFVRQAPVILRF